MIHFLVTRRYAYTLKKFLRTPWGQECADEMCVLTYERASWKRSFRPGTYVFTDIERLGPAATERAAALHDRLASDRAAYRVLNHPVHTWRRYRLLRTLHEQGTNAFSVYRLEEGAGSVRYPAFLRGENDHRGNSTELLKDHEQLSEAVAGLKRIPDEPLLTEFLDTSIDGVFRKYSAFRIGSEIIARHLFFGRRWMLKGPELSGAQYVAEEFAYVHDNPHRAALAEFFDLARVEYGRIDYSLLEGRIQVWEINSNPMIASENSLRNRARRPAHDLAIGRIVTALRTLDSVEAMR
jgi:hypothetical protein